MKWLRAAEFKVGLLVIVVGSLIAVMSMQVSDDPSYLGRSKKAWFLLPNAGGLVKNSTVRSAGIPVGIIKDIRLQDGQARVDITVKSEVPLTTSASIEIKAQGILGDSHVEVSPGSPTDPPLPDNAQILIVKFKGSLENLMGEVGEVAASLKVISKNLQEATSEDGSRKSILGRIVKNIETITSDLSQVTSANKDKIGDIVDEIHDVTTTLQTIANDEGNQGFKKTWEHLSATLKSLDDVAAKINHGEGTLGKLISDEATAEKVESALDGLNEMVSAASRVQTAMDFRTEYLGAIGSWKSTLGVYIQPGLDRFYYIGVVDDPAGVSETTRTVTSGSINTNITEQKNYQNKTKLTLLFGKNFWNFAIRGGIIENGGGFGVDYYFFRRKLKVSSELFDFTRMNWRTFATYYFYRGLYVNAGVNDTFDKNSARSGYIGAGLYLTNDDLKLLLTRGL
jgi:phospholipid/cholesterol/gamma-HCH transport system substrate-binding protein